MAVVLQAVSVRQLSYSLTTDSASASHHPRPAATSSGRSSLVSISCVGGEMHGSPTYARAAVSSLSYSITALFTPHRVIVQYRANGRFAGIDLPHFRGGFTFFWGGISPPKYGLNKTLPNGRGVQVFRRTNRKMTVLFISLPRSEGWPHHGRTFSIYLYPLSF